jgi:hypothetical protein
MEKSRALRVTSEQVYDLEDNLRERGFIVQNQEFIECDGISYISVLWCDQDMSWVKTVKKGENSSLWFGDGAEPLIEDVKLGEKLL